MTSTKYTYKVASVEMGTTATLIRKSDGATKLFFLANRNVAAIGQHMASLTDACCDGFFPAPRKTAS